MIEVWKSINGFDNYQVSNTGLVKSLERWMPMPHGGKYFQKEKILKVSIVRGGYCQITLSVNGKPSMKKLHRIVADAFISNPENKPQINHKDGNKLNNNVSNLEWCTSSENHIHAFATGLRTSHTGQQHQNSKLVLNTETGIFYESLTEAIKTQTLKRSTIEAMMCGRNPNRTSFIYV